MFSKFKQLFTSESLLDSAYETTVKMLEFCEEMFEASRRTLRETDTTELSFDIKNTDRKINKYLREVRRNVLTHLSVAGTANLVPGLVLVSIVIDVERIGDYTKNIVDLAASYQKPLEGGKHEATLQKLEGIIPPHFETAIEVLRTQDTRLARKVMKEEQAIAQESDAVVAALVRNGESSFATSQAVAVAMYARYLKRINAHLTNVASAIVNPFPRIGFREKKSRKKDELL